MSVTDRCNFRCAYCMPRDHFGPGFAFLPRKELLSFEELVRLARVFAGLGVRKLRLTGGEPLLRAELPKLISMLAEIAGLELALTTNGALLSKHADAIARAGLRRVTVSVDSLDDAVFRSVNDVDFPVAQVLEGIKAARAAGLRPIKVNAVVRRGVNDSGIEDLVRYFRGTPHILRFIEYMDVGATNGWRMDEVMSGEEILARIARVAPIEPVGPTHPGEVAERWRYLDGQGEVGVITSVTRPFCAECSRVRLSANGKLYTCLFASTGTDLRAMLREGGTDADVTDALSRIWRSREDNYSERRTARTEDVSRIEMSFIGG